MRRVLGALLVAFAALPAATAPAATPPPAPSPVAERAVRWGLSQVGVRELGNTNCGRTVERWQRRTGWRVPPCWEWCGAFVHEAFLQAGLNLGGRWRNPEHALDNARAHRHGLWAIPVRSVRRGDLVIFRWGDTDSRADHFGIVTHRYRRGDWFVRTVDGNSGNMVQTGRRSLIYAVTGVRTIPPRGVRAGVR